jgi:hypothetical protein
MFAALFGLACLHPSMKSTALSAPLGELGGHAVVASESALAETERLVRLDLPAMSETAYSSVESNTQV